MLFQDILNRKADPIDFLGYKVPNPLGAVRLAEMTDSLILPLITVNSFSFGKKTPRWEIHFWNAIDCRNKETKKQLVSSLEEMIKTYPEAWGLWSTIAPVI